MNKPSRANEPAFQNAVETISHTAMDLLAELETTAPPRDRETEAAKAKERAAARYGVSSN